jgi:hypothetical protein
LLVGVVEQCPIYDHGLRHESSIKVEGFESEGVFEQIVFPTNSFNAQDISRKMVQEDLSDCNVLQEWQGHESDSVLQMVSKHLG